MLTNMLEKSTLPSKSPMGGIKMSLTSEVTIFPKAAPRMIPMAMSITFPRMANSLNSFSMFLSSFNFQRTTDYGQRTVYSKPLAFATTPEYACRRTNSTQPGVHMATTLPDYVRASVPNPPANRGPWYKNTAPSYAGIFLWVAFYLGLAGPTISQASLGVALLGLVVAGLLCFGFYYYVPAMLGMPTGRPLHVVGTSTFRPTGGSVMPGLLIGLLQLGWFAVSTFFATKFILSGVHSEAQPGSLPFIVIGVIWGYLMAYIGVMGIQYVARVSLYLNL